MAARRRGIPLSHSACQHAIRTRRPLRDRGRPPRPARAGQPGDRDAGRSSAYIGVPLLGSGGTTIGTLCAIDTRPQGVDRRTTRACCRISPRPSTAYLEARPAPQQLGSGLNIAAVARRDRRSGPTRCASAERRYGVLRPSRTSGGQRRYDERDVARVRVAARPPRPRASGSARPRALLGDGPGERRVLAGRTAGCDRRSGRRDGHAPARRPGRAVVHAPRRRDRRRGDRGTRSAADRRPLGGRRGVHRRGASAQRGRARAAPDAAWATAVRPSAARPCSPARRGSGTSSGCSRWPSCSRPTAG